MPTGIYLRTEYHRKRLSESHRGIKLPPFSAEHKRKISEAKSGSKYPNRKSSAPFTFNHKAKIRLAHIKQNNQNWKGDEVKYRALHSWIHRWLGKPKYCEFCGKEKDTPKSIHWANKSGRYLRDLTDWISLCAKCHKEYDLEKI